MLTANETRLKGSSKAQKTPNSGHIISTNYQCDVSCNNHKIIANGLHYITQPIFAMNIETLALGMEWKLKASTLYLDMLIGQIF